MLFDYNYTANKRLWVSKISIEEMDNYFKSFSTFSMQFMIKFFWTEKDHKLCRWYMKNTSWTLNTRVVIIFDSLFEVTDDQWLLIFVFSHRSASWTLAQIPTHWNRHFYQFLKLDIGMVWTKSKDLLIVIFGKNFAHH